MSAELIDQTEFVPRQRYCFRHPLVRAVAYESQLSAAGHRPIAGWPRRLSARSGAVDENAALIATHLEAAGEVVEAYHWHLRAAEWLRPRDVPAARAEWESARRIADRLADDYDGVTAMRIAPRAMLISTALYVGNAAAPTISTASFVNSHLRVRRSDIARARDRRTHLVVQPSTKSGFPRRDRWHRSSKRWSAASIVTRRRRST